MTSSASFQSSIDNLDQKDPSYISKLIDFGSNCSQPDHIDNIQKIITQLFTSKADISAEFRDKLSTISKTHFLQLYDNLTDIFDCLSAQDLLSMARVCKFTKNRIESNPKLQARIAHFYLTKMRDKENVPLHEMKIELSNKGNLVVEVATDLTLWKLTHQFQKSLPWITILITKECSTELPALFTNLKTCNQLQSLYLSECEWKPEFLNSLKEIQSLGNGQKPPTVFLSNTKSEIIDSQVSSSLTFVVTKAERSIEQILWEPEDNIDLKEFEKKAQDLNASSQDVVTAMDKLKPVIRSQIVSFIWYSILYKTTEKETSVKQKMKDATRDFVAKNPHHPAIIAAVRKHKKDENAY